jgi:hypothetical protein
MAVVDRKHLAHQYHSCLVIRIVRVRFLNEEISNSVLLHLFKMCPWQRSNVQENPKKKKIEVAENTVGVNLDYLPKKSSLSFSLSGRSITLLQKVQVRFHSWQITRTADSLSDCPSVYDNSLITNINILRKRVRGGVSYVSAGLA